MNKSRIKTPIIATLLFLICVWLFTYIIGPIDTFPRFHASAKNHDGSLIVNIYRKRIWHNYIYPRMGVLAKVQNERGEVLYENIIFNDDDCINEVGEAYTDIQFDGEDIKIGPGFFDRWRYVVIKRADLSAH